MDFSIDPGSAAIAALALAVSIHSAWATRHHNRLSVKPRLTTTTSRDQVSEGDTCVLKVRVTLENVGLGPAIVKSAEVLLDGEPVSVESSEDCRELLQKSISGLLLGPTVFFMKLNKEHAIATGSETGIVSCTIFNPPQDIKRQLERFALRIHFESLYGQGFVYDSREHLSP